MKDVLLYETVPHATRMDAHPPPENVPNEKAIDIRQPLHTCARISNPLVFEFVHIVSLGSSQSQTSEESLSRSAHTLCHVTESTRSHSATTPIHTLLLFTDLLRHLLFKTAASIQISLNDISTPKLSPHLSKKPRAYGTRSHTATTPIHTLIFFSYRTALVVGAARQREVQVFRSVGVACRVGSELAPR